MNDLTQHRLLKSEQQFYRARVENNDDPEKMGRIQVRILGLHDQNKSKVPTASLPWAECIQSFMFARDKGIGLSTLPLIDTWVWVFLENNDFNYPIVIGTTYGITDGKEDFHSDASPTNTVIETNAGHIIEIDDTEGNERIHIHHTSGTDIEIDKDGNYTRTVVKSLTDTIQEDETKTINGNETKTVSGEVTDTTSGSNTITAATIFLN